MQKQVTGAYLNGIREGRELLSNFPNTFDAEHEYKQAKQAVRQFSGVMKDFHLGLRDFWLNQLKINK